MEHHDSKHLCLALTNILDGWPEGISTLGVCVREQCAHKQSFDTLESLCVTIALVTHMPCKTPLHN